MTLLSRLEKREQSIMRAIVITHSGGPDVLVIEQRPEPTPAAGQVLIEVKAFGLNHAEVYFRSGAWGDVAYAVASSAAPGITALLDQMKLARTGP